MDSLGGLGGGGGGDEELEVEAVAEDAVGVAEGAFVEEVVNVGASETDAGAALAAVGTMGVEEVGDRLEEAR